MKVHYYYYYLLLHNHSITVCYSYGHSPGLNFLVTGRSNLVANSWLLVSHTYMSRSTCFERYFRSSSGASKLYYNFWYYTRMSLPAALHVSSYIFAHHQEHLNCITASGITHVCRCRLLYMFRAIFSLIIRSI